MGQRQQLPWQHTLAGSRAAFALPTAPPQPAPPTGGASSAACLACRLSSAFSHARCASAAAPCGCQADNSRAWHLSTLSHSVAAPLCRMGAIPLQVPMRCLRLSPLPRTAIFFSASAPSCSDRWCSRLASRRTFTTRQQPLERSIAAAGAAARPRSSAAAGAMPRRCRRRQPIPRPYPIPQCARLDQRAAGRLRVLHRLLRLGQVQLRLGGLQVSRLDQRIGLRRLGTTAVRPQCRLAEAHACDIASVKGAGAAPPGTDEAALPAACHPHPAAPLASDLSSFRRRSSSCASPCFSPAARSVEAGMPVAELGKCKGGWPVRGTWTSCP